MGKFPTPLTIVEGCLTCSMPSMPGFDLKLSHPEWFTYDFIFKQYGFPNLSLSYVKPILEWFEIIMELIPPPTKPSKIPPYLQKLMSIISNMTLPSMQAKTLLDLKFPDIFEKPPFNYISSLQWLLLRVPKIPKLPKYQVEFNGIKYYPPNLYDLVFAHFTVKFDLFSDLIIGPLKKPEMPKVPSPEDFINIYLNKINMKLNLPTIPLWMLQSPTYRIKIPAISLHMQNFCQAKFFVDMVKILVGG